MSETKMKKLWIGVYKYEGEYGGWGTTTSYETLEDLKRNVDNHKEFHFIQIEVDGSNNTEE
jgi:hypothetical protein